MSHPSHEQIAKRAYELWQQRGGFHGSHEADWYRAERDLNEEDSALIGVARKVGGALGTVVAFFNDPLHSSGG